MIALPQKTGTLTSADGVKIFYRHYPAESEGARMVIAHGLGEHSGRYGNVVERMLPKTKLGRSQLTKFRVFCGPEHTHAAQNPEVLDVASMNSKNKRSA